MYNLLNIYDCPNCGKILSDQVTHGETCDTERDEVYAYCSCNKCGRDVTMRVSYDIKSRQEMMHYEEVDEERAKWAHGFYDEPDDDFENEN